MKISTIVIVGILIENSYCANNHEIVRAKDGDQFPACCNCCQKYQAFCLQNYRCHCNFALTFYKDSNGNKMCVKDPDEVDQCQFHMVDSYVDEHNFSDGNLGILKVKDHLSIRKCNLVSSSLYKFESWTPLKENDFQLRQKGKFYRLTFTGNPSTYEGYLLKSVIKCNGFQSCLMFKIGGIMKRNNLPQYFSNTTAIPINKNNSGSKPSQWLLGVIVGSVSLVALILIFILVMCVRKCKSRKNNKGKSSKSIKEKNNQSLITENTTNTNRNSLHENTVMYVSDENQKELDSVYIDPDLAFSGKKPLKDSDYDYPYMKHHNFRKCLEKPGDKHEYAIITTDHPYDDPESTPCPKSLKSIGYAELEDIKTENPYNDPESIPCPESRKSIGYAVLDDIKIEPASSPYQTLKVEDDPDNVLKQDETDSLSYFQLADDENAI